MRTLGRWERRFTTTPCLIECHKMEIFRALGSEPPLFSGPGCIDISSLTRIYFTMHATIESQDALHQLMSAQKNPYVMDEQLRLEATDYQGVKWLCGFTLPRLKGVPKVGCPLTGQLASLSTIDFGDYVSKIPSVELIFSPKLQLPMEKIMESVTSIEGKEINRTSSAGRHSIRVLDSEINFFYPPAGDSLWITATTSEKIETPYAENWLSEPLRILLGQRAYPRLIARNHGDGTAQIGILPSPSHYNDSSIASLVWGDPFNNRTEFWDLYEKIILFFARSNAAQGKFATFPHLLTQYYDEIIDATQGSTWVHCLTLASAAEGIAKMLMKPEDLKSDFAEQDISDLKKLVNNWKGDPDLRSRVLNSISFCEKKSVGKYLKELTACGILKTENEKAWSSLRNVVMHGGLVSPWISEKEEKLLVDLADLVHRLTRKLITRL